MKKISDVVSNYILQLNLRKKNLLDFSESQRKCPLLPENIIKILSILRLPI